MEQQIAQALEAAAFNHTQHEIELGAEDKHWAQWYSQWLLSESEISDVFNNHYSAEQLALLLTRLQGLYNEQTPDWSLFYAEQIAKEVVYDEIPVNEDLGPESDV